MLDYSFGQWLQQRRKALHLTQADLAQQVGCATVTIRKIELDERRPSKEIATRLAACLQIGEEERMAFLRFARGEKSTIQPTPLPPHVLPVPASPVTASHASLPVPATPVLGREHEVATLANLLCRTDVRLVTLTGPGGVGKTRLALQVTAELSSVFAHGAVFVALGPILDPALVLPTIARTLGLSETGGQLLQERLIHYLRDKQLLLVLDNMEHLLAAALHISTLLTAAPYLTVLVTSRTVLHLAGEHEFPVSPLPLPDLTRLPPIEALTDYPAIRLFRDRAQAVNPSFQLNDATGQPVAEICVRLDGLPLAIELAAARSKILSPSALLGRLNRRLAVLTGGARDLPARQQALRSTIDWSYQLLDPPEQTVFARLAVFVGGCTLDAAEAVCHADGDVALDVLDGLQSLIDNSLLRQADGPASEPRFSMLETIREYAWDQLERSGEADALQRAHARYYLALAEQAEPQLTGPQQGVWLARLEREHANLRAALHWAKDRGEAELGLRLGGALGRFWLYRGYLSEGRAWLAGALAGGRQARPARQAKALRAAGRLAWRQGDYVWATALLEESLALARDLGDKEGIASSLTNLGTVALEQRDYTRATILFGQSLALERELGGKEGIAWGLEGLAAIGGAQGQTARAARLWGAAEMLRETMGTPLPPVDRDRYTHAVTAARAHVDEAAFAVAWAEGRAMVLEQAIADALQAEGRAASPSHGANGSVRRRSSADG